MVFILVIVICIGLGSSQPILSDEERTNIMAYLAPRRNFPSIKRSFDDPWSSIMNGKLFQDIDESRSGMNYKGLRG
uniref:Uncharacterized protein n=1 Tax=Acrobeloides nanus TaxID=290746 RepID=A0A914DNM2_9BILA